MADLSASSAALSESTDPTSHNLSAGDQTAAIAQYGDTVTVSDILQETWVPSSMGALMERIARVAAKKIDTVVRDAAFTAGGTVQYAGAAVARNSIATTGMDMSIAEVREAINTLEDAGAQPFADGYYRGIIHPDVKNLTSKNLFNSVKLQNGQYRAKPLGEGVTNIREILRKAIKRCSELGRNAERITEMLFRSLSLQPNVA